MLLDHPRLENTAHFTFNIIQLDTSIFQWCPCSSPLVDKLKLHADAETLGTESRIYRGRAGWTDGWMFKFDVCVSSSPQPTERREPRNNCL